MVYIDSVILSQKICHLVLALLPDRLNNSTNFASSFTFSVKNQAQDLKESNSRLSLSLSLSLHHVQARGDPQCRSGKPNV